jgi:DNA-binding MarR family transcriptional regulator
MANQTNIESAKKMLEVIPMVMGGVGREMRKRQVIDITMPQFRALMTIRFHPEIAMSGIAQHLDVTLSSASKLIDGLVDRGWVQRAESAEDRRKTLLSLSPAGKEIIEEFHQQKLNYFTELLKDLTDEECITLNNAANILHTIFDPMVPEHIKRIKEGELK